MDLEFFLPCDLSKALRHQFPGVKRVSQTPLNSNLWAADFAFFGLRFPSPCSRGNWPQSVERHLHLTVVSWHSDSSCLVVRSKALLLWARLTLTGCSILNCARSFVLKCLGAWAAKHGVPVTLVITFTN